MDATESEIIALLKDITRSKREIAADENLFDTGVLTSFTFIVFLSRLEKAFALSFVTADIAKDNFADVKSIVRFVRGKKGK